MAVRFYGARENKREIDMDMREMVDKVKKGEPLYGKSELTEYMQGVATRNSRYSAVFGHLIPWPNFVNHNQVRDAIPLRSQDGVGYGRLEANVPRQHGVDTAKYYQQAERELEAERTGQ